MSRGCRRSREPRLRFLTHNVRGLKSDGVRFDGYVEWARKRDVFVASLQETWMEGEAVMEHMADYPGWTLLRHGLKDPDDQLLITSLRFSHLFSFFSSSIDLSLTSDPR